MTDPDVDRMATLVMGGIVGVENVSEEVKARIRAKTSSTEFRYLLWLAFHAGATWALDHAHERKLTVEPREAFEAWLQEAGDAEA